MTRSTIPALILMVFAGCTSDTGRDSIWVTMRYTADARRALILDGEGEPIGTFPLPPRATIRQATSTHVWMTQTDEDGLATVLRYRVSVRR